MREEKTVNKCSARVIGAALYCRTAPSKQSRAWGKFPEGSVIAIAPCRSEGWYETLWQGIHKGYVMKQYVEIVSPAAAYAKGDFVRLCKPHVNLRKHPYASLLNRLGQGALLCIEGTELSRSLQGDPLWLKVRFGMRHGSYDIRYVHSSCVGEAIAMEADAKHRMAQMAVSLVGNTGAALGLYGQWCQNFIYWLASACGMDICMPYGEAYCGRARKILCERCGAQWHVKGDGHIPQTGDLIYYGKPDDMRSTHVGFVVQGGATFQTVEGNLRNTVKHCEGSVHTGKCNHREYQGFVCWQTL